jgi:hypothetical protein
MRPQILLAAAIVAGWLVPTLAPAGTINAAAPKLDPDACTSPDFDLRRYDLAEEACVANFTTSPLTKLDLQSIRDNRKACRATRTGGLATCRARHTDRRALRSCRRAVNSINRACLIQANYRPFLELGPKVFRAYTCGAALHGLLEICYHYRRKLLGGGSPSSTPGSCTETCVEECMEVYYEDYDYNAEQVCYYDYCAC